MLANAPAAALSTLAPLSVMLADDAAPAALSTPAPPPVMLADAAPAAVSTKMLLPLVCAQAPWRGGPWGITSLRGQTRSCQDGQHESWRPWPHLDKFVLSAVASESAEIGAHRILTGQRHYTCD